MNRKSQKGLWFSWAKQSHTQETSTGNVYYKHDLYKLPQGQLNFKSHHTHTRFVCLFVSLSLSFLLCLVTL